MKRDDEIREFDALVPKAAENHVDTWCMKRQRKILTRWLDGKECCNCPEFVLRGGVCDPL